jgi:hypothetical protein
MFETAVLGHSGMFHYLPSPVTTRGPGYQNERRSCPSHLITSLYFKAELRKLSSPLLSSPGLSQTAQSDFSRTSAAVLNFYLFRSLTFAIPIPYKVDYGFTGTKQTSVSSYKTVTERRRQLLCTLNFDQTASSKNRAVL